MKKMNKKGFTLIELLAVIVVLAVLILIAVTAVVPQMTRARKQALVTEAATFVNAAREYFLYRELQGDTTTSCVRIDEVNNKDNLLGEYIDEKGKTSYAGTVTYDRSNDTFSISLTNGNYYLYVSDAGDLSTTGEDAVVDSAPANYSAACATDTDH